MAKNDTFDHFYHLGLFLAEIFCQIAIHMKPQQNAFSREITIFTKIIIFRFQKCKKKHAVIVKNRIRVSFIISGLIFWVVLIQVLELYRGWRIRLDYDYLIFYKNGHFFEIDRLNPCLTRKRENFCRKRRFLVG